MEGDKVSMNIILSRCQRSFNYQKARVYWSKGSQKNSKNKRTLSSRHTKIILRPETCESHSLDCCFYPRNCVYLYPRPNLLNSFDKMLTRHIKRLKELKPRQGKFWWEKEQKDLQQYYMHIEFFLGHYTMETWQSKNSMSTFNCL